MKELIPIITALVSALIIVIGYIYNKKRERDFEIFRRRQELYTSYADIFSQRLRIWEKITSDDKFPEKFNKETTPEIVKLIREDYPDYFDVVEEERRIIIHLSLYASDEAIQSIFKFIVDSQESIIKGEGRGDPGELILNLRKTLFPHSKVRPEMINRIATSLQ